MRTYIFALCTICLASACADDSSEPRPTSSDGNNLSNGGSAGAGGESASGGSAGTSDAAGSGGMAGGPAGAGGGASGGSGGPPTLPSDCYYPSNDTSCGGQYKHTTVFCTLGTPMPVWQPLLDDGCVIGSASDPSAIILCCPFPAP